MKNQFNTDNFPDVEPSELIAGARWGWKRSEITAVYPTATYTLKYRLNLQTSTGTATTITAGKTASEHVVEVDIAATSGYAPGEYQWQAVVERDSDNEQVVVDEGYFTVLADLSTGDARSWVYKVLSAIQATILGTASREESSYSVGGRALAARTPGELLELEKEFLTRWNQEKAAQDRKAGRAIKSRVLVKMRA